MAFEKCKKCGWSKLTLRGEFVVRLVTTPPSRPHCSMTIWSCGRCLRHQSRAVPIKS